MEKRQQEQLNNLVKRLFYARSKEKRAKEYKAEVEEEVLDTITSIMRTSGHDSCDCVVSDSRYGVDETILKVTKYRPVKVEYIVEKLKAKLPRQTFEKIVSSKRIYVVNYNQLVMYLKSCGVDPKEFKKYIKVEEQVDRKRLENLYNIGEIKKSDIVGCYNITQGRETVRITEVKK